jgi:radical SAM protein with 4Fe4S-binding SPASM domain
MGIGNVKEGLECWDTHEYVETIRSMRAEDDTTCGQCEYLPYCGGCIACGYLVKGTLQCYDPYRCPFYKAYGEIVGFSSGC